MKYERLEIGPYNLHVIKTDKFKKNVISLSFKENFNKKNITMRSMLASMLVRATQKYPDERSMSIASEELYNVTYNGTNSIYGNYMIMDIDLTFLDTKYTSDELSKESIEFLKEMIFNPLVKDKKFDE